MTTEEKQLLIADLCARLPYRVECKINYTFNNETTDWEDVESTCDDIITKINFDTKEVFSDWLSEYSSIDDVKPYLRPMSSMTEEERGVSEQVYKNGGFWAHFDWLNAHHFDYRGLIEKGLALEAPHEMYNKEESEKGSDVPIPKTVDEAISTLEKILSDEDRDYLLENGAISMHNSLGRWIRNEWGLWTDSELKNELKKKGFEHPDDMSNYIIEEFIKYWNSKI